MCIDNGADVVYDGNAFTKQFKQKDNTMKSTNPTPTTNDEHAFVKMLKLALALTQLVTVYVFATQDNPVLWGLAAVHGIAAVVYFVQKNVLK